MTCGGPTDIDKDTCDCDPLGACPWRDTSGVAERLEGKTMDDLRYEEITRRLKDLNDKLDAVITAVKEVPYLAKIIQEGKTTPPPREPETWVLRAVLVARTEPEEDDEDEDEEDRYYIGTVIQSMERNLRHIWTTDYSDAMTFPSQDLARRYYMMNNPETPKAPAGYLWRVSLQRLVKGRGSNTLRRGTNREDHAELHLPSNPAG